MAVLLAESMDAPDGQGVALSGEDIRARLSLEPEQINDAVDELESLGLARALKYYGTSPYNFGQIEPTTSLAFQLRGTSVLSYDPEEDVRIVAAAIAQHKRVTGPMLQETTKLTPSRLNRAIAYLADYNIIEVHAYFNTAPFSFGDALATSATRRFLTAN